MKMRGLGRSYGELEVTIGIDYYLVVAIYIDDCHTGHQGHQIIHTLLFDSQTDTDFKMLIIVPLIDIFNLFSVWSDQIVTIYSL